MSVHLIEHNMGGVQNADDPSLGPWRLTAILRVPEFMEVAALFLYGNERVVVRGPSREELESWAAENRIPTHPRLINLTIEEAP
jgi:hypothetical protein